MQHMHPPLASFPQSLSYAARAKGAPHAARGVRNIRARRLTVPSTRDAGNESKHAPASSLCDKPDTLEV
jgi:hypothetical protein